jgi:hypothetical protein
MRDFGLNLAASDLLALFNSEEFDREGNLYPICLAFAWLAATCCLGSIHLFFDIELMENIIAAQTEEAMSDDEAGFPDYKVPESIRHPLETLDSPVGDGEIKLLALQHVRPTTPR